MESLASKYRPQSYAEVVGQTEAVNLLVPLVQRRAPRHYLFTGETGTGKTSLALITARAYRCTGDRSRSLPCLRCTACAEIGLGAQFGFEDYPAPNLSNGMLDDILANAGFVGLTGPRAIFIDEAHDLKPLARDKLLTALEKVSSTIFMFATDRPEELDPRLTDRLLKVRLSPLDFETSFRHLRDVCAREGLIYDEDGLELIAEVSAGSARALLENLDEVSAGGELIAPDLVRSRLKLDRLKAYVPTLVALLAGDLAKSVACLNRIIAKPQDKAEALQALIIQIHENAILGLSRPGIGIAGIEPEQRRSIADAVILLAARKGVSPDHLFHHLAMQLAPATGKIDDGWLKTKLLGLKTFLHSEPVQTLKISRSRQPGRTLKQPRERRSRESEGYLTKDKVASIVDAASYLAQAHGKLLNFRMIFFHERLQFDQAQGSELVASCLHELGMRIKAWSRGGENLHYMYLHQVSGKVGFNTTVVGSIPIDYAYDVANWLDGFLHRVRNFQSATDAVRLKFHRIVDADSQLRQHWRFLRNLCRNLDPNLKVEEGGRPRKIVELLKIDQRIQEPHGAPSVAHPIRISSSLSASAMRKTPLPTLSAFRDGAWNELQSGWELQEFFDRRGELRKLEGQIRRIQEEFGNDPDLRASELDLLFRSISKNPYHRERTWRIWRISMDRTRRRHAETTVGRSLG